MSRRCRGKERGHKTDVLSFHGVICFRARLTARFPKRGRRTSELKGYFSLEGRTENPLARWLLPNGKTIPLLKYRRRALVWLVFDGQVVQ